MVRRRKTFLRVHACTHLGCGTEQNTDAPGVHVAKELGLAYVRVGVMDKGDLVGGNAPCHELLLHVVVNGELGRGQRDQGIHVSGHGSILTVIIFLVGGCAPEAPAFVSRQKPAHVFSFH